MTSIHQPDHLRCEYQRNPLGIDEPKPRFSWEMRDDRRNAVQTAYQLMVAEKLDALESEQLLLWDTGMVNSSQSNHIAYEGPGLHARRRYWWKVRLWDSEQIASPWSPPAWWEMGLCGRQAWQGQWIGSSVLVGGPRTTSPSPYLRTTFIIPAPISHARLYITALGLFEAHVNGQRISEDCFTPGWTDYSRRVQYQTYDICALLTPGRNALGVVLGDGWYCGHWAHRDRQTYGDRPRLLAQLEINCINNETVRVVTNPLWRVSSGPILESDLLMGESYDARLALPGWSEPEYDDTGWLSARVFADPGIDICASPAPPVRRIEEIHPVSVTPHSVGWQGIEWIFDMGQNIAGCVKLRIKGERGQTVRIRHAEMLQPDGSLYTASLRTARATEYYTFASDGFEEYEPHFTYHGFRYVSVFGPKEAPELNSVTGIVLHGDHRPIGTFECSDQRVNRLYTSIRWTQKANLFEVPTDCPNRDERMGWTGDAQLFAPTGAYLTELAPFMTKWLKDIADAQEENGSVPPTAPRCPGIGSDGGPGWSEALITVPWTIYEHCGDRRILEYNYGSMKALVGYLEKTSVNLIRPADRSAGFGDWLSPDGSTPWGTGTPRDIIGTAYFARAAHLLSRIAAVLGREEEQEKYHDLARRIAMAFRERFVTPIGQVLGNTQTSCLLSLAFDLLEPGQQNAAVDQLLSLIHQHSEHLATGLMGTALLCPVLSRFGHDGMAYKLLLQDSYPSWLFMIEQDATTLWERWNSWTPENGFADASMNSFNHPALASIGEWLYAWVAGIRPDPEQPGFRHAIIDPRPGPGLTWARGSVDCMYGRVESTWRKVRDGLELSVRIPANAWATVHLPAKSLEIVTDSGLPVSTAPGIRSAAVNKGKVIVEIGAGAYCFHVRDD